VQGRTGNQHNAYNFTDWFSRADRDGNFVAILKSNVTPPERAIAQATSSSSLGSKIYDGGPGAAANGW